MRMTFNMNSLNFGLDIAAFLFGVGIFFGCIQTHRGDKKAKLFHIFVIFSTLTALLDALTYLTDGTVHETATMLITTSLYVIGVMTYYVGTCYHIQFFEKPGKGVRIFKLVVLCLTAVMVVLSLLNMKFGFFFRLSNHTLTAGKLYIASQAYGMLVLLSNMGLVAWNRVMDNKTRLTLFCYMAGPYISIMISSFLPISLLSFSAVFSVFIIYINLYTEQNKTLIETESRLLDTKVKLMMSQIQPHFLYNALSSISYLCTEDPNEAEKATNEFADYLKVNLKSINSDTPIPFEEELKHTETYLNIEKRRFPKKLKVWYDIKATNFNIPALTVQPIAENAVRYGVESRFEPTLIIISSYEGDDEYIVKVSDDGGGFDADNVMKDGSEHIGISGVKNRLSEMSGGSMEIKSVIGKGTEVIFHIPKTVSEEEE